MIGTLGARHHGFLASGAVESGAHRSSPTEIPSYDARVLPAPFAAPARALAGCLFDAGRGVPEDRLDFALDDVDDFTRRAGTKTRLAFVASLLLLEWLWPLAFGLFGRFSRLPLARRLHLLERIEETALAPLLVLPKAMLCLVYFEHPEALREIGYDAKPLRALEAPRS